MDETDSAAPEVTPTRELRVLVLHNRDFPSSATDEPESSLSPDAQSRLDVANAARSVARSLAARGHFAEVQGIDRDDIPELLNRLREDPPDVVFNLVESLLNDDYHGAAIPTLLDLFSIPYTGIGPFSFQAMLRKHIAGQLLRAGGVPTPVSVLLPAASRSREEDRTLLESMAYPLILKLDDTSGSIGVSNRSVIHDEAGLFAQLDYLRETYQRPILAERYVAGREIYVSMLGNAPPEILPLQEVDFSRLPSELPHIVNENAKWIAGTLEYDAISSVAIGPLHPTVRARVEEAARRAFALLGARDYARCDIRLAENGRPYVIDVNGNCDLSEDAGYARAAYLAGLSYEQLIERIALAALQRTQDARRISKALRASHPSRRSG